MSYSSLSSNRFLKLDIYIYLVNWRFPINIFVSLWKMVFFRWKINENTVFRWFLVSNSADRCFSDKYRNFSVFEILGRSEAISYDNKWFLVICDEFRAPLKIFYWKSGVADPLTAGPAPRLAQWCKNPKQILSVKNIVF